MKKLLSLFLSTLLLAGLCTAVLTGCAEKTDEELALNVDEFYVIPDAGVMDEFSSDDTQVANVANGAIVAVNEGSTIIRRTSGGEEYTYRVTVTDNTSDEDKAFGNFTDIDDETAFIGAGYNVIFSGYINGNEAQIINPIFDIDAIIDSGKLRLNHMTRVVGMSASGNTMDSFMSSYSKQLSASLGASYGSFFSASVNVDFSSLAKSSLTEKQEFMKFHTSAQTMTLTFREKVDSYRDYLDESFARDLADSDVTPEELFEKYGTHVITSAAYGGRLDFNYYLYSTDSSTSQEDIEKIGGKLSAGIGSFKADGSVNVSNEYKEEAASKHVNIMNSVQVYGGEPMDMASLETVTANYGAWLKTIADAPTMIGVLNPNSLYPIWELLPDTPEGNVRKAELSAAFSELADGSYDKLLEDYFISGASASLTYGEYPQTLASPDVMNALASGAGEVAGTYLTEGDVITYSGKKYLAYSPEVTHNGYDAHTTYYFEFEPITWSYYDTDMNGQRLFVANKALDYRSYFWTYYDLYDVASARGPLDDWFWETSGLRSFLNGKFMSLAFQNEPRSRLGYVHVYNRAHPAKGESSLVMDSVSIAPYRENYYADGVVLTDFAIARGAPDNCHYFASPSDYVDPNVCGLEADLHGVCITFFEYNPSTRYWYFWRNPSPEYSAPVVPCIALK